MDKQKKERMTIQVENFVLNQNCPDLCIVQRSRYQYNTACLGKYGFDIILGTDGLDCVVHYY